MTHPSEGVKEGRRAVEAREWRRAHGALTAARLEGSLGPPDLWRLAVAAYLVGEEADFVDALQDAHHAWLDAGDVLEAVRAAFWLGQHLASRGEMARASGWFGRTARLVDERQAEGAAQGYALLTTGHRQLMEDRLEESAQTSARAGEIGRRCRERDLTAMGTHMQGRALLRLGRLREGVSLLDEAMVAVAGDELSPVATGLIYCSVLSACREIHDLHRASEWTTALSDWCAGQPDMIAYTGPCLVSRAEIMQQRGEWSRAVEEAQMAADRFARGSGPGSAGPALYQKGEIHRLRGEHAAAEEAYRAAAAAGREPQPGLALLRLAQGAGDAAVAAIRRCLAEARPPLSRARLLPAFIEILVARGELDDAWGACEELDGIAATWPGPALEAVAAQARGATLLARGDAQGALPQLRRACRAWVALDAPYEAARVRVLLAAACEAHGDIDGAALERVTARAAFERLGAAPELERMGTARGGTAHGLTPREREVLRWLATGRTNRAIGETLHISEKTVARHVANIYGKLGVSSRAAATAYAYEHDLARPPTPPT